MLFLCLLPRNGALPAITPWFIRPQERIIINLNISALLLSLHARFHFLLILILLYFSYRITTADTLLLQDEFYIKHAQRLNEVRNVFREVGEDTLESLTMIDAVQRLAIDYHFKEEIEAVLQRQYVKGSTHGESIQDLHEVALRFRLLRQEGYHVPAGGISFDFSKICYESHCF